MIKKYISFALLFFVFSCSNIEFVLKQNNKQNLLRDTTALLLPGGTEERFSRELYSVFGRAKSYEYVLRTTFLEKKENRIVKTNQVAEKIDYTLEVNYDLFYKTVECRIFSKNITSTFSFTPKSAGYNFGADISFDRLYTNSLKKNIQRFVDLVPDNKACL